MPIKEESLQQDNNQGTLMDTDHLVENHYKKVYKLCLFYLRNPQEAEDATQQVFVKVVEKLDEFKGTANVYTWIYRIAVNTCLNILNRKRILRWFSLDSGGSEVNHTMGFSTDPAKHLETVETNELNLEKLDKAIETLSKREKTAFYLFHYDHLKQKEIAKIMGASTAAVEVLVHKAMKKIKNSVRS